jgi:enoyl-CoA hydratase/long-chain 3-hydroxyacyl-CoA dehydrogenase
MVGAYAKFTLVFGCSPLNRLLFQIPIDQAFDLMLTGKTVRPDKAKKIGLIDQVVDSLGRYFD